MNAMSILSKYRFSLFFAIQRFYLGRMAKVPL